MVSQLRQPSTLQLQTNDRFPFILLMYNTRNKESSKHTKDNVNMIWYKMYACLMQNKRAIQWKTKEQFNAQP